MTLFYEAKANSWEETALKKLILVGAKSARKVFIFTYLYLYEYIYK